MIRVHMLDGEALDFKADDFHDVGGALNLYVEATVGGVRCGSPVRVAVIPKDTWRFASRVPDSEEQRP